MKDRAAVEEAVQLGSAGGGIECRLLIMLLLYGIFFRIWPTFVVEISHASTLFVDQRLLYNY